jgi:hypothetical protein
MLKIIDFKGSQIDVHYSYENHEPEIGYEGGITIDKLVIGGEDVTELLDCFMDEIYEMFE